MTPTPTSLPLEDTVVIVGVGLIGGSLAAALKRQKIARHVIGVGRHLARIQAAQHAGLIDEAVTDLKTVVGRADVVIFCTPVDAVASDVREAARALQEPGDASRRATPTLLTDVGSVKSPICDNLSDVPDFIGSHPIAGSHRQGFEAADDRLFDGRTCVVTPLATSPQPQIDRLTRLWRAVGMQTVQMSPATHDRSLAMTSHLPHVVAAALATTLTPENRSLTGTGFRDTSRVAAGDPDLWTGILLNNATQVADGIEEVERQLRAYREALLSGDSTAIRQLLSHGQSMRRLLDES